MQLVAPAGNISALHAAVTYGADAVYLGMPKFGARAKAENFDRDALVSAVKYAHVFGTKVFVTLNTLIKDSELDDALGSARFAYECGVDALIVQDIRFIKRLKESLPEMPLHASTQMGIHNADGAKTMLDMGIRRAVLSRETLPKDITEIKKTGIEIEFFVQGALCIAFSGNCYLSSLASSYSGNRGKCMQLCRKKYELNGQSGYYLSAKDICLYPRLEYLASLGVDAIKIEGRMRSPEYVAQAVKVYKSAMPAEKAVQALKSVYNRGDYCTAYLEEGAPFRVVYPKSQANIGVSVGNIERINGNRIDISGKFSAHKNDGFKVMRNGTEVCGATVKNGAITVDGPARKGDELRRTFDGALSDSLANYEHKIPIRAEVFLKSGDKPHAILYADGTKIETVGDMEVQSAVSRELTEADIVRAFSKTSDYPFAPTVHAEIDGKTFLPISLLNEFRRNAYERLFDALAAPPKRGKTKEFSFEFNRFDGSGTILLTDNPAALPKSVLDKIDILAISPSDYSVVPNMKIDCGKPVLLSLPVTMRGEDKPILKRAVEMPFIDGVISNNYYTFNLTRKPILLGTGHNIIGKTDLPHICSFETDSIDEGGWAYVFGYAPVMTLCHCPYGKCIKCSGRDVLIDEGGRRFALRRYKTAHCYWELLNSVPHMLAKNGIYPYKNKFFDCRGLDSAETEKVLAGEYTRAYTRGNINKGLK